MNRYEEVIKTTSGLIYMIINKYFHGQDKEDLYQVGIIGVIKAYNKYKEDKQTKFSTFAYKYIYGEIYAYVTKSNTMKVSKEQITLYKKINKAKSILCQRLMKEPTTYELASFLELPISLVEAATIPVIDSLDEPIYDNDITLFDTISDKKDYYNIDAILLEDEINKLESPYKELIYLRYYKDKTQSEVAQILGMNQVQVSRNEKETLKKIKKLCREVA